MPLSFLDFKQPIAVFKVTFTIPARTLTRKTAASASRYLRIRLTRGSATMAR